MTWIVVTFVLVLATLAYGALTRIAQSLEQLVNYWIRYYHEEEKRGATDEQ